MITLGHFICHWLNRILFVCSGPPIWKQNGKTMKASFHIIHECKNQLRSRKQLIMQQLRSVRAVNLPDPVLRQWEKSAMCGVRSHSIKCYRIQLLLSLLQQKNWLNLPVASTTTSDTISGKLFPYNNPLAA